MSGKTGIQWTDSTWNPVTGCTRVSAGCANCYIERTPPFRMAGRRFARVDNLSTTGVTLHWDRLFDRPPPRGPKIFTPSLSDLFHEDVPRQFVEAFLDVVRTYPDRQFQVLTKRPERAYAMLEGRQATPDEVDDGFELGYVPGIMYDQPPIPNLWLGVSIENARYTWRADALRAIHCAGIRFISAEPLLGSLLKAPSASERDDARAARRLARPASDADGPTLTEASARRGVAGKQGSKYERSHTAAMLDLSGIDWLIIGGESGPGARPFQLEHAHELIAAARAVPCKGDMCTGCDADGYCHYPVRPGTPAVFVKQLGAKPVLSLDGWMAALELRDRMGGDMDEWPADLRIREFPSV